MASKEIKTSIIIQATPEKVWSIFSNFKNYPNWNPFLTLIEGNLRKGNKIKIIAGGMKFNPVVLSHIKEKELIWVGRLFFKGLFDGEHKFEFIDNLNGSTTFKHEEKFQGVLVGLFSKKIDNEVKPGFIEMNKKLKEICEGISSL